MSKGEVILTQFAHHEGGMLDKFDLSAAGARIRNRLSVPDQRF
jgi:hypothetical protein